MEGKFRSRIELSVENAPPLRFSSFITRYVLPLDLRPATQYSLRYCEC